MRLRMAGGPATRPPMKNLDPIAELMRACAEAGSKRRWALAHGVTAVYVGDVLAGKREPGPAILDALEIERLVIYRRKQEGNDHDGGSLAQRGRHGAVSQRPRGAAAPDGAGRAVAAAELPSRKNPAPVGSAGARSGHEGSATNTRRASRRAAGGR